MKGLEEQTKVDRKMAFSRREPSSKRCSLLSAQSILIMKSMQYYALISKQAVRQLKWQTSKQAVESNSNSSVFRHAESDTDPETLAVMADNLSRVPPECILFPWPDHRVPSGFFMFYRGSFTVIALLPVFSSGPGMYSRISGMPTSMEKWQG